MSIQLGKATEAEQVQAVREYAERNYEKGGWDYIVECWSDDEIKDKIAGVKTRWGAIERIRACIAPLASYRADIQATAW